MHDITTLSKGYGTLTHDASKTKMIQKGLQAGMPIVLGYLPVAVTFGVLASQVGMSLTELTLMSALVYAGASQFMGANMIAAQASAIEIVVATFVLNFRHFIMSFSFSNLVRETIPLKSRLLLSLGLTDETFAVTALKKENAGEKNSGYFFGTVILIAYLSWVSGSFIGGLLGEIIPEQLSQSMGIALYAMFIGLLVPAVKKSLRLLLIALVAMFFNLLFSQFISPGWSIVLGTVIGGATGIYFLKDEDL